MGLARELYARIARRDPEADSGLAPAAEARAHESFLLILASQILTKLGDALASPKTTLAWLTSAVGAPPVVLGLLVPLRESMAMVPQLQVGAMVRRRRLRKPIWVAASLAQGAAVLTLALTAGFARGPLAGVLIVSAVAAFSLARCFASVTSKDVVGRAVARPVRGQLSGLAASAAGLLTLVAGLALAGAGRAEPVDLALLLGGAALAWFAAAAVFARVSEAPGEVVTEASSAGALRLLVVDRAFRRFVAARALCMASALSAPYYVGLAQTEGPSDDGQLGAFVVAAGLAGLVSGPVWGRLADRSSRAVLVAGALFAAGAGLLTAAAAWLAPAVAHAPAFAGVAYFGLSLAHAGVRVGRKTYVVNLGEGDQRTRYVSVSNAVIGALLLVAGGVGALVPLIGHAGVIAVLALMALAGAGLAATLPETSEAPRAPSG